MPETQKLIQQPFSNVMQRNLTCSSVSCVMLSNLFCLHSAHPFRGTAAGESRGKGFGSGLYSSLRPPSGLRRDSGGVKRDSLRVSFSSETFCSFVQPALILTRTRLGVSPRRRWRVRQVRFQLRGVRDSPTRQPRTGRRRPCPSARALLRHSPHHLVLLSPFLFFLIGRVLQLLVSHAEKQGQPGLGIDENAPDSAARTIASIGGQLWQRQLLSLMTSVNKWPVSLVRTFIPCILGVL